MKSKTKGYIAAAAAVIALVVLFNFLQSEAVFQSSSQEEAINKHKEIPVPGRVTLLDLGANDCQPCKMMAPILEELKQAYTDRAEIIFIDVRDNRKVAQEYSIRAIPTQIFFNAQGQEVLRHTGFMDKETIIENLADLGVEPPEEYQDL